MAENSEPEYTVKGYLLYKLDRTLAILGIVILGTYAIFASAGENQIALAAIAGLVGYVGGRSGN